MANFFAHAQGNSELFVKDLLVDLKIRGMPVLHGLRKTVGTFILAALAMQTTIGYCVRGRRTFRSHLQVRPTFCVFATVVSYFFAVRVQVANAQQVQRKACSYFQNRTCTKGSNANFDMVMSRLSKLSQTHSNFSERHALIFKTGRAPRDPNANFDMVMSKSAGFLLEVSNTDAVTCNCSFFL